jgi:hypothetical protein
MDLGEKERGQCRDRLTQFRLGLNRFPCSMHCIRVRHARAKSAKRVFAISPGIHVLAATKTPDGRDKSPAMTNQQANRAGQRLLPKRQHMPRIKVLPDDIPNVHPKKKNRWATLIETTLA